SGGNSAGRQPGHRRRSSLCRRGERGQRGAFRLCRSRCHRVRGDGPMSAAVEPHAASHLPPARRRGPDLLPYVAGGLTLFVLAAFLAFPILSTMANSFAPAGEALSLVNATLDNFQRFWTSALYQRALVNTLVIGVSVTMLA